MLIVVLLVALALVVLLALIADARLIRAIFTRGDTTDKLLWGLGFFAVTAIGAAAVLAFLIGLAFLQCGPNCFS